MIPISDKLAGMLQEQIAHELRNELIYRTAASWANTLMLKGIFAYFSKQADGERDHAGWIMDILKDANVPLSIPPITVPPVPATCSELAAFYVSTEAGTTDALETICHQSDAEYNIAVQDLMQKLLREQNEEEGASDAFSKLVSISNGDMILLDLALR